MNQIFSNCDLLLQELSLFIEDLVYLGPQITDNRLELFEKQIGYQLPSDFKYILKNHNGISLLGTGVYGIDTRLGALSLDEMYRFEHNETSNNTPAYLLPFSADGQGNHYCLDLSKLSDDICPVVFWQHDIDYTEHTIEECNQSFADWVKEVMIDWALNDFNYNGSDKEI